MAGRAALRRREAGTGGSLTQPPVVPGRHEDAGTGSSPLVGDSLVPVPVCATVQLLFKIPSFGGRCRCRCPGSDAADDVIL